MLGKMTLMMGVILSSMSLSLRRKVRQVWSGCTWPSLWLRSLRSQLGWRGGWPGFRGRWTPMPWSSINRRRQSEHFGQSSGDTRIQRATTSEIRSLMKMTTWSYLITNMYQIHYPNHYHCPSSSTWFWMKCRWIFISWELCISKRCRRLKFRSSRRMRNTNLKMCTALPKSISCRLDSDLEKQNHMNKNKKSIAFISSS